MVFEYMRESIGAIAQVCSVTLPVAFSPWISAKRTRSTCHPHDPRLRICKATVPGGVKTRLVPVLGNESAAALASAMFVDVWSSVTACPGVRPILATTEFRKFPVEIPADDIWFQGEGDLGVRLERIMTSGLLRAPVKAVGADSPTLTSSHIIRALQTLDTNDAVIGPCIDGGFYLLSLFAFK